MLKHALRPVPNAAPAAQPRARSIGTVLRLWTPLTSADRPVAHRLMANVRFACLLPTLNARNMMLGRPLDIYPLNVLLPSG